MVRLAPGRGHRRLPARRGRRRPSGSGSASARAGRSWSASPGWCRARARTRCCGPGRGSGPRSAATRCCCWSATGRTGPSWAGWPTGLGLHDSVVFAGPVPSEELPAYYDAGNVFAMPCRTRRGGLDVEGLGIVYLEASATGLPVVGGDSGGAPDAILEGETGYVVPGEDAARRAADRAAGRPRRGGRDGREGEAWVDSEWRWELVAERLTRSWPAAAATAGSPSRARTRWVRAWATALEGLAARIARSRLASARSARGSTRRRSRSSTG